MKGGFRKEVRFVVECEIGCLFSCFFQLNEQVWFPAGMPAPFKSGSRPICVRICYIGCLLARQKGHILLPVHHDVRNGTFF